MVGEKYDHCLVIASIAKEIGIDVLFTDDLMFCGKNFYSSVYDIKEGHKQFYMFETKP